MRKLKFFFRSLLPVVPIIWIFFLTSTLAADPQSGTYEGRLISQIRYVDLRTTQSLVIDRELQVHQGLPFHSADLEESAQRLRNLMIFIRVDAEVSEAKEAPGKVDVTFTFLEKWTILPIIKVGGAGDVQYFQLGVYDVNFLGRYLELGARYDNIASRSSGLVWYRDPRLLGVRIRFGLDVASITRLRGVYTAAGALDRSFALQRRQIVTFLESEIDPRFTLGLSLDLRFDRLTNEGLTYAQNQVNAAQSFTPSGFSRTPTASGYFAIGRIDYDDFLADGHQTRVRLSKSIGKWATASIHSMDLETGHHFRLLQDHNLAIRAQVAATSSQTLQDLYFLGGLESIRGYLDGQFSGDSYWLLNSEYRIPSFQHPWIVIQHAAFIDLLQMTHLPGLFYSLGTGIRLLCPKIYRLAVRFDYAFHFRPDFGHGISFGLSQFY